MAKQFTLGKNERLKSRKQIEVLFSKGQKLVVQPFRISYLFSMAAEKESPLKFGVGASARYFKKAVDRNRIKRLIREAWRLQKNELLLQLKEQNRHLDVFFIYTGKELPEYKDISDQMATAIKKLMSK